MIVSGLSHSKVVDILRKAEGTVQLTICRDILPLSYSESPTLLNMSSQTEAIVAEPPAPDTRSSPDDMLNRPVEHPPGMNSCLCYYHEFVESGCGIQSCGKLNPEYFIMKTMLDKVLMDNKFFDLINLYLTIYTVFLNCCFRGDSRPRGQRNGCCPNVATSSATPTDYRNGRDRNHTGNMHNNKRTHTQIRE